jgi:hypothetical protein
LREFSGGVKAIQMGVRRGQVENMVEPFAPQTMGVVFPPASKPKMEFLHVF